MKSSIKRKSTFFRGFWDGLSSPARIYYISDYLKHRSARDAMRSDWMKIGGDFRNAMSQHGEKPLEDR